MKCKLPEGWEEVKLIEITEKIGSGATPRGGAKVYIDVGVNLIRSQNVLDLEFSTDGLVCIDGDAAEKLNNVEVFKNDILINITGDSVARTCLVPDDILPARVNQHVSIIRTDEALAYHKYISYKLQDLKILLLSYSSSGATRKALTKSMLENLKISLPQISEQQAIADTLSSLDNKIELNNKINQNLEQQAQAIFKHWFVDFEFLDEDGKPYKSSGGQMVESELGMIPKGWRIGEIKDYADVKSGYAFKSSWWKDEGVTVLKIANISSGKLSLDNCSFVDEERIPEDDRYIAYPSDLLIALTGATLGKMAIIPKLKETLLINQRVGKFIYKEEYEYPLPFLYSLLNTEDIMSEIIDRGQGSAQPNISPTSLGSIEFIYPTNEVINKFNKALEPFFKQYVYSYNQSMKLSNLRDTLLPKLMSGEIRIPLD